MVGGSKCEIPKYLKFHCQQYLLGHNDMPDLLFDTLVGLHRGPWGRFLDAGTGVQSLQWVSSEIASLATDN